MEGEEGVPSCLVLASVRFFFLGPFFTKKPRFEHFTVDDSKAAGPECSCAQSRAQRMRSLLAGRPLGQVTRPRASLLAEITRLPQT